MSESFKAWLESEAGQRGLAYAEQAPGAGLGMAWDAAIDAVVAAIPDNWLDALLTGPKGIKIPANCPDVERLLNGVRERAIALRVMEIPPKCPSK